MGIWVAIKYIDLRSPYGFAFVQGRRRAGYVVEAPGYFKSFARCTQARRARRDKFRIMNACRLIDRPGKRGLPDTIIDGIDLR
jgi:hypothetical protein